MYRRVVYYSTGHLNVEDEDNLKVEENVQEGDDVQQGDIVQKDTT